ncbi:hypothetical protein HDV02_002508 [Globomyces sp. JEL0801]|nr:hypothetical protein HDV02_002508 [Globomyces sp. JEL0801]
MVLKLIRSCSIITIQKRGLLTSQTVPRGIQIINTSKRNVPKTTNDLESLGISIKSNHEQPMQTNISSKELKQILLDEITNPKLIPSTIGYVDPTLFDVTSQFEVELKDEISSNLQMENMNDPWSYYLCIRHDKQKLQEIPRELFSYMIHYIVMINTTPTIFFDQIQTILQDMDFVKHKLAIIDWKLIFIALQKCHLVNDYQLIFTEMDNWALYQEPYEDKELKYSTIVDYLVAHYCKNKSIVVLSQFLPFLTENFPKLFLLLKTDIMNYISQHSTFRNESNGSQVLECTNHILKCTFQYQSYLKLQHYVELIHILHDNLQYVDDCECKQYELTKRSVLEMVKYQISHQPIKNPLTIMIYFKILDHFRLIDHIETLYNHILDRKFNYFIPLELTFMYIDLLLKFGLQDSATHYFRSFISKLPLKHRRLMRPIQPDYHARFIKLCLDRDCIPSAFRHCQVMFDCKIGLDDDTLKRLDTFAKDSRERLVVRKMSKFKELQHR